MKNTDLNSIDMATEKLRLITGSNNFEIDKLASTIPGFNIVNLTSLNITHDINNRCEKALESFNEVFGCLPETDKTYSYSYEIIRVLEQAKKSESFKIFYPEAFLHPRKISAMFSYVFLKALRKGNPLTLITHSYYILNRARIAVLRKKINVNNLSIGYIDNHGKLHNIVVNKDGRIDYWPDGFFDEMDYQFEELLG